MKKYLEKLQKEKETLLERLRLINDAIISSQEVCEHVDEIGGETWEYAGSDSHKSYYVCTICGKKRSE